jgi:hypothetical protein
MHELHPWSWFFYSHASSIELAWPASYGSTCCDRDEKSTTSRRFHAYSVVAVACGELLPGARAMVSRGFAPLRDCCGPAHFFLASDMHCLLQRAALTPSTVYRKFAWSNVMSRTSSMRVSCYLKWCFSHSFGEVGLKNQTQPCCSMQWCAAVLYKRVCSSFILTSVCTVAVAALCSLFSSYSADSLVHSAIQSFWNV